MRRQHKPKIIKRKTSKEHYTFYVDCGKINGSRQKIRCKSREEAEETQERIFQERLKHGNKAVFELSEAAKAGVTYNLARLKEFGATLDEAVAFFVKHSRPEKGILTISEAIDLWEAEKKRNNNVPDSIKTALDSYYKPFANHFSPETKTTELSFTDIEKYLNERTSWSPITFNNHKRYLSGLYNFLIKKRHCTLNPLENIASRLHRAGRIKFLSPEEVKKLLQYCVDNELHYQLAIVALVAFCGIRTDEVGRLEWPDIDLEEKTVEVGEKSAKKPKRRVNTISKNAWYWLSKIPKEARTGDVVPVKIEGYKSAMNRLRKKCSITYAQNALRHCFATYHLAEHGSYEATAQMLGHPNGQQLYANYKELTKKKTANEFWRTYPDGVFEAAKAARKEELLTRLRTRKSEYENLENQFTYDRFVLDEDNLKLAGILDYTSAEGEQRNEKTLVDYSEEYENFSL